jgi:D-3-phosphoglycerate dehydrogenase
MKVLISDNLAPIGAKILKDAGIEVDINTGLAPEELKKIIPEYDGLVIRSATKVTEEIIDAADNLKVVGRAGIGLDNVDIPTASQRGIVVMNAPDGNSTTAAESLGSNGLISTLIISRRNLSPLSCGPG